jgi:uncharacterized membrane protein YsdA (DUF1294 family)
MKWQEAPFRRFSLVAVVCTLAGVFILYLSFQFPLLWAYILSINTVAFALCGYDKNVAGSADWRVPENVLISSALLGGSAGLLLGMNLFRHKTHKAKFQFFLALILVLQVALLRFIR